MTPRPGTKFIHKFPAGECCVGMISHSGRVFIATNQAIYELKQSWFRWFLNKMRFISVR